MGVLKVKVGAFNNVIDAFAAYKKAKETYLVELAEKWKGKIDDRDNCARYPSIPRVPSFIGFRHIEDIS